MNEGGIGYGPRRTRGSGVRVYVCCCPFMLLLAPPILLGRLARYGALRLLGRPAGSPWPEPQDSGVATTGEGRP
jgi:hypothetical protein